MKILDYGIHMNEKHEPVMVFTLEVALIVDYGEPEDIRHMLEEYLRQERENKND